jgi:hypothetical protein
MVDWKNAKANATLKASQKTICFLAIPHVIETANVSKERPKARSVSVTKDMITKIF